MEQNKLYMLISSQIQFITSLVYIPSEAKSTESAAELRTDHALRDRGAGNMLYINNILKQEARLYIVLYLIIKMWSLSRTEL